jgi:uncharacterized cupredoxin-like copper-binding protein
MRRVLGALAIVAVAVALLGATPGVGTGSTRPSSAGSGGRTIAVTGSSFSFTPRKIALQAGERVTIVLRSTDVLHDFVVQGVGRVVSAKGGKTRRGSLMLGKPGKYKFWCSIRGHRGAGMAGTITVR